MNRKTVFELDSVICKLESRIGCTDGIYDPEKGFLLNGDGELGINMPTELVWEVVRDLIEIREELIAMEKGTEMPDLGTGTIKIELERSTEEKVKSFGELAYAIGYLEGVYQIVNDNEVLTGNAQLEFRQALDTVKAVSGFNRIMGRDV